jgi:hypothetical protein
MDGDFPMYLERESGMPENVPQVGVGFTLHPLEDQEASNKAGSPIYKDVEFIKIQVPGDPGNIVFQPATDVHRRKYPTAYAIFKKQMAAPVEGTPLEQWPAMTRAMALTLKAAGIPTVQMLAEVHEGNLDKLGHGAREWVAKAKGFLKQAASSAAAQELEKKNQQLLDLIADLQAQIRDLGKRLGDPDTAAEKALEAAVDRVNAKARPKAKPRPKAAAAAA